MPEKITKEKSVGKVRGASSKTSEAGNLKKPGDKPVSDEERGCSFVSQVVDGLMGGMEEEEKVDKHQDVSLKVTFQSFKVSELHKKLKHYRLHNLEIPAARRAYIHRRVSSSASQ